MPNDNALEGIACPNCKQDAEFQITATATFDVTDEGTGDYQGVEWGPDSPISCQKCGHMGTVKQFSPPISYVLISDALGIFLGEVLGLGFWSRMDSLEMPTATSHPLEHAQNIAARHLKDHAVRLHPIPTEPRDHTATELDTYGLEKYTRELHENTKTASGEA